MAWNQLDTRAWNLAAGATVLATSACGPLLVPGDTDGGTDSTAEDDGADTETPTGPVDTSTSTSTPPNPTTPNPTTPTTPPQRDCYDDSDCGYGYDCIDYVCVEDYYCASYCCYDGCCGSGCYYEECYDDNDCGDGALCENYGYGECVGFPSPEQCGDPLELQGDELPLMGSEIVSLTFVEDASGSALVIGRSDGADILQTGIPSSERLILPGGPIVDAAGADFDGDGDLDIALLQNDGAQSQIQRALGDGGGTFSLGAPIFLDGNVLDVESLGGGPPDIVIARANEDVQVLLNGGMGTFDPPAVLGLGEADSIATGRFGLDDFDDVAASWETSRIVVRTEEGDYNGDYNGRPGRTLHAVELDGSGSQHPVGVTPISSNWTLLELSSWSLGNQGIALYANTTASDVGDVDGDGAEDIVMLGGGYIYVARGGLDRLFVRCFDEVPVKLLYSHVAVGDLDGDGLDDIVAATSEQIFVYFNPA